MTYGLRNGVFRLAEQVCALRLRWRQCGMVLRSQDRHARHVQKALTPMNIPLTNVWRTCDRGIGQ